MEGRENGWWTKDPGGAGTEAQVEEIIFSTEYSEAKCQLATPALMPSCPDVWPLFHSLSTRDSALVRGAGEI